MSNKAQYEVLTQEDFLILARGRTIAEVSYEKELMSERKRELDDEEDDIDWTSGLLITFTDGTECFIRAFTEEGWPIGAAYLRTWFTEPTLPIEELRRLSKFKPL